MKKLTLLSIIPFAIIMADMNFPTSAQKGDSMSVVGVEDNENVLPAPVNTSGIIPNSVDLIWEDSQGKNIGFTCATGYMDQFSGPVTKHYSKIGDSAQGFRIPTVNMWNEVEEEGDGSTCSHSINKATNTRVETATWRGWWLDASGNWNAMPASTTQSGTQHPPTDGLVTGVRGCYAQYFVDEREKLDVTKLIIPYDGNFRNPSDINILSKPQDYFRFHGWSNSKAVLPDAYAMKAIFIQQYARLVVDDPNGPDDRHLARYLIHMGSDRKEVDGTQLWEIGMSRFKRVTNDWQPFNLFAGPQTKAELEANPPPFMSMP